MQPIQRPPTRRVQRGCFFQFVLVIASLTLCTLATCGTLMLVYLVAPPPSLNVAVMGLDSRDGEGMVTRSDAVLLVGIKGFRLNVASIPRDVFIRVPGYGEPQRVNTINVLGEINQDGGGPRLLQDSIELSFGVAVGHYVRMDFDAFRQMIDSVGGVTVDVPSRIQDFAFPTDDFGTMTVTFEAGRQRMNGERALIYARMRNPDDDYRRTERQQQVLVAFARKAALPIYWPGLLAVLTRNVETNLSPFELIRMLPAAVFGIGNAEQFVINRDYVLPGAGGVVPDYERVNRIFGEMFGR